MKPETGNNNSPSVKKVSIQLSLDGHSFSAPSLSDEFPGDEPVVVEWLTAQTILVPAELFAEQRSEALLAAAGLPLKAGQRPVWTNAVEKAVAVMAVAEEPYQAVVAKLGDRCRFTTPLLYRPKMTDAVVWLCPKPGLLYIKVYDRVLRLAEVIPTNAEPDMRYFIERVGDVFPLDEYRLLLSSDDEDARNLRKLVEPYFLEVLCE